MRALSLEEFMLAADPDGLCICRTVDGLWQARCGDFALRCPGTGLAAFDDLDHLLRILSGAGVRCSRIEWDGLPAVPYERDASKPIAKGDGDRVDSHDALHRGNLGF